jgi:membrane-associated phospholipid phosphatase
MMCSKHPWRALLLTVTMLVCVSAARADEPVQQPVSPYRFRWTLDAPIVSLGVAGTLGYLVEPRPPACAASPQACPAPDNLPGFDRGALGLYSRPALTVGNIMIGALLLGPHLANVVGTRAEGAAWIEDAAITAESVLVAQALTQAMKAATDRYAPLMYNPDSDLSARYSPDASRSFWSGHTATAFAAATSFATSYWLRHPRSPWRWVVLATVESAALWAGLLKIRAGYHWPTDIAAGAAAGIGVGIMIPALHMP